MYLGLILENHLGYISAFFLLIITSYSIVWIKHDLFSHSSTDRHFDLFQTLIIINNDAMSIRIQVLVSVTRSTLTSFGCTHRSETARLYDSYNFLRHHEMFSHGSCIILLRHQQHVRLPGSLHPFQTSWKWLLYWAGSGISPQCKFELIWLMRWLSFIVINNKVCAIMPN